MDNRKSQRTRRCASRSCKISVRDLRVTPNNGDREDLVFITEYLTSLLKDIHFNLHQLYGKSDYLKDLATLNRRLKSEGIFFATHVLPILITDLLNLLEGRRAVFPGYKLQKGTNYPRFLRRLFSAVCNDCHDAKVQAAALESIYMVSVSFKKLRGDYDKNILKQQYEEFCTVDASLEDIDLFSDDVSPIVENARSRWSVFAHDITLDHESFKPRPGPGATVDNVQKSKRYAPHVLFKQLDKVFPYDEWFFSHPWDVVEQSRDYLKLLNSSRTSPYSEFLFVPKTREKPRGICKESNEAQFFQQALRSGLAHFISKKLAKHLPLLDQTVHGALALNASYTRDDATIDESEASDRIARTLVSWVSQDNVELHNALMAVSTRWIKPPKLKGLHKSHLETQKFAPMGSGVCFPVMSLIHLFLIQAIISTKIHDITAETKQDFLDRVSVYGDDIVVPSHCVPYIYEWLPRFGMKINQDKSYYRSFFRESCGTHGYKGHEVTPVYIKYTNSTHNSDMSETQLISLLESETQLYSRNYTSTAAFLRRAIHAKWRKTSLPYVCTGSPLLGFRRPSTSMEITNFNTSGYRRKWDVALQSWAYRVPVLKVRSVVGQINAHNEAYLRYQCVSARETARLRSATIDDLVNAICFSCSTAEERQKILSDTPVMQWDVLDSVTGLKASRTFLPESVCHNVAERLEVSIP